MERRDEFGNAISARDPSPAEIQAALAEIRSRWTQREEWNRRVVKSGELVAESLYELGKC